MDKDNLVQLLEYYIELVEKQQASMQKMAQLIKEQGELIAQIKSVEDADSEAGEAAAVSDSDKLGYTE